MKKCRSNVSKISIPNFSSFLAKKVLKFVVKITKQNLFCKFWCLRIRFEVNYQTLGKLREFTKQNIGMPKTRVKKIQKSRFRKVLVFLEKLRKIEKKYSGFVIFKLRLWKIEAERIEFGNAKCQKKLVEKIEKFHFNLLICVGNFSSN